MKAWITMFVAGIAAAAALFSAPAPAQPAPGTLIKIMVGFPPGQATDTVARLLAEQLGTELGQPVIVENRPGQGGSIAMAMVAKAPPDGATMTLSALAAYSVNPHLYKHVGYRTLKDLDPIASVADLPLALVVNPKLPVHTVQELVAYAKAHPHELSHPSSGNGTLSHLLMEDFKRRAGIDIVHVPYQGSAKAMTDLVAGTVEVGLDTFTVTLPLVKAGKLRLLAVGTAHRVPTLPDVPTIAESGFPGFEGVAWIGLTAPAGTPLAWRERVSNAVATSLKNPEFVKRLENLGAYPRPGDVDQFSSLLHTEYARWGEIVKASGVTVN
jgi:tripartite-type tricarboxylate transporter receptor subunit TctC